MASIFFDFELPNPTTWFYFSALLAVALFFKFSRLLSMRNLDVLTLFLFAPGLLLLAEGGTHDFFGYLWLMIACLYFLVRCLIDLALVRRPSLGANLDLSGLAWLAGALFVSLIAVASRQPVGAEKVEGAKGDPIGKLPILGEKAFKPIAGPGVDDSHLYLWAERGLALLCHLSVVVALVLIGWRHFDDIRAGMSAATFYLLLPYTFLLLPDSALGVGRWDHAWPMALTLWAVFCYRRPVLAGMFLGVATGTAFFLLVILPAWLSFYRHRGATRFLVSFVVSATLGLAVLGGLLYLNGELPSGLRSDWTTFDWQPWKRPAAGTPGFWPDMPSDRVVRTSSAYRVPVFLATMVFVLGSAFWPTPKNLAHLIALSAATLLSIQFWYADRGGVYVFWFLPLLLLLVFRPNLSATAPPVPPSDDWIVGMSRRLGRLVRWRRPKPIEPVQPSAMRNGGFVAP
jgi:hypothetical protein